MVDIIHRIGIRASSKEVYKALSTIEGLSNWWTEEVEGDETIGGKIKFTFRSETGDVKGQMVMQVAALSPDKKVRWQCVDGPAEWLALLLHLTCRNRTIKSSSSSAIETGVRQLNLQRIVA